MTPYQFFEDKKDYYCSLFSMNCNNTDIAIYYYESNKCCCIFFNKDIERSIYETIEIFKDDRVPYYLFAKNNKEKARSLYWLDRQWLEQTEYPYSGFSKYLFKAINIEIDVDDVLNQHKRYIGYCPGPDAIKDIMFELGKSKKTNLIHIVNFDG